MVFKVVILYCVLLCNYFGNFVYMEIGTLKITSCGVVPVGCCGDGVVGHGTLRLSGDAE